eukprot:gnl/TRDRNA2_/TRDRNA2_89124_c0_seq2.p1 gnl/TRDRNA2_/TRDRNA2_89124_c0~~gnl/TRDRNA2_/TRDRNA2_89124_c0_seq2.p1  ORF type:complete len:276 (+),score=39.38 gnl/TRDRNA2_/TRDRNA2_89124_c0_seq2:50-877(+)
MAICRRCCWFLGGQSDAQPLRNATEMSEQGRATDSARQTRVTGAAASEGTPPRFDLEHTSAQPDSRGVLPCPAEARGSESREDQNRLSSTSAALASSPPPFSPRRKDETVPGATIEEQVKNWVEIVSGENKGSDQSTMEWLKDGQVLCRLANKLEPRICPRVNTQQLPFKQMENVTAFIHACRKLGVMEKDVFSTVDLFEGKSEKAVINCIANLGSVVRRTAPMFHGPYIGVAQKAAVTDVARTKQLAQQDGGFRADVASELRDGVKQGRQFGRM